MRYLVTGAAGLIGSALVNKLAEDKSNHISAYDKKEMYFKQTNVFKHICDLKEVQWLPENVDVVFHLAAYNGTKHFYDKPYEVIKDNILPTLKLLEYYREYSNTRPLFIYTGTPESVAGTYTFPTPESEPYHVEDPLNPRWSYANSKALGEQAVIHNGVLDYIIVRPQNIYGPGQKDHFIPEFVERVENGKFELYGWQNTRTFLYIDDAVDALIKLSKCDKINTIYNLGGDKETAIGNVAFLILDLMGKHLDTKLKFYNAPKGSVYRRWPDITKIKEAIDWKPTTSLREGLKKTILL